SFNDKEQAYVFLQVRQLPEDKTYESYRERKKTLLKTYMYCLKAKFFLEAPDWKLNRIAGIALEPPKYADVGCDDLISIDYYNCFFGVSVWIRVLKIWFL
ncbi:MAG: hypothetical protein LBL71_00980, partial [Endomicrobium sp.]|nr:hypothetical protein [Endomicrobium sp.]